MIKERLLEYINFKRITKSFFEKSICASNGYINNVKTLGSDKLEDIIKKYPDLNIIWLLTGEGDMINESININLENNHDIISGNYNVAGKVSGHIANISLPPGVQAKIINDEGIEATCVPMSDHSTQQEVQALKLEIENLKSEVEKWRNKYILLLEEKAGLK